MYNNIKMGKENISVIGNFEDICHVYKNKKKIRALETEFINNNRL